MRLPFEEMRVAEAVKTIANLTCPSPLRAKDTVLLGVQVLPPLGVRPGHFLAHGCPSGKVFLRKARVAPLLRQINPARPAFG